MPADPNRIAAIFTGALAQATPEERGAYLDEACGGDAELRRRVEALLQAHADAGSFLEKPGVSATTDQPAGQWIERDAPPVLAERPGMRVGRYKLLQQIGEGGMGVVYMAEQEQPVRRKVALKIIKPGMDSAQVIARFEAERQALAMMDHQNIARVLDAGTTDSGRPYFVMELVHGVPITKFCDDSQLTPRQRLELFIPVCQAIQHAHQKGIIHRDIKPSNVLVTMHDDKPVPKVIDFGVAKATEQRLTEKSLFTAFGSVVGTLEYMSPEQAEMNAFGVDTRGDVYSLGVLLYELLTGTTPLERKRLREAAYSEVVRLIKEVEPPRPSMRLSSSGDLPKIAASRKMEPEKLSRLLRGEIDWIVMRCLEKDRTRRYESAHALARDVERYLRDEAVEACPPSVVYRLRKFARKNRVALSTGVAFAAMLFVVFGLIVFGAWWTDRQSADRRHEQALIVARNNDALKATLDQVETALKSGRIDEAGALLGQAARQIDDQTIPDLRERRTQLEKDERAVRELNDIFEERWMISRSDTRLDNTRAKQRYPALFHQYGLDVGLESAEQSVKKIQRSSVVDGLSSGVAEWFFIDPKYPGLLAIVDLLDPEPDRTKMRTAIANGDNARISEISKMIDGSRLPPAYAIGLGTHRACRDRLRILRAAWTTHPDSFALSLVICGRLVLRGQDLRDEAIGWGRTAVALRPNNALALYYLALALSFYKDSDRGNAVPELRRASQLAPRFARAFGLLALNLSWDHKNPEALAAARKAIELDYQNPYGHVVILWDCLTKEDYVGAAKVFWQITGLKQDMDGLESSFEQGYMGGVTSMAIDRIQVGLIRVGRPLEAYRLEVAGHSGGHSTTIVHPDHSLYNPTCAAVLAGTGQGLDTPSPAERPAIRKHALEWLSSSLKDWQRHATDLPVLVARSVSLAGSPFGGGPLLSVCCLSPERTDLSAERARDREAVHKRMNEWLQDADLAGVRDEPWLAKLPGEEREQWRGFWRRVRSLRDQTAPATTAPLPIRK
jgi:serine/threonine protein kinase